MIAEQKQSESLITHLQKARDTERHRLISKILEQEEQAALIVNHLLEFQKAQEAFSFEQEQIEQDELLKKVFFKVLFYFHTILNVVIF